MREDYNTDASAGLCYLKKMFKETAENPPEFLHLKKGFFVGFFF